MSGQKRGKHIAASGCTKARQNPADLPSWEKVRPVIKRYPEVKGVDILATGMV